MKDFVRPGDLVKGPGVEGLESEVFRCFILCGFFTILLLGKNL